MNGTFWGHLVKAIGYAAVGAADEDTEAEAPAPKRRPALNGFARKKGCCNAKRPAANADKSGPAPEGAFSGVRRVRSAGRGGSTEG